MSLPPKEAIRNHALDLGFDVVGFAKPDPGDGARHNLAAYLAAGHQAGMGWMERRAEERGDPRRYYPPARTAILVGLNYAPEAMPEDRPGIGLISVYARGRDYHDVMTPKLEALAAWLVETHGAQARAFVDTAPVMEKPLAALAGLGWQGKHTNLVSRRFGSWLFLGGVLTDLEIPADRPEPDRCGRCTRCLDACPTQAIAPYRIDAGRCISYLTIEHKGDLPADLARRFGRRIFGCDACLAVCPWNKFAIPSAEPAFASRTADLPLDAFEAMDDRSFRTRFAESPIKRTGLARMRRNAQTALRNESEAAHG
ncbi:MAG: tRNA epoxyqueuosine(34) reductase QueG [Rhodospirillales bacterium]|nr:tRNA epoxyqueuosine(34) reductase QueG [Rhodospirillales bacterium]